MFFCQCTNENSNTGDNENNREIAAEEETVEIKNTNTPEKKEPEVQEDEKKSVEKTAENYECPCEIRGYITDPDEYSNLRKSPGGEVAIKIPVENKEYGYATIITAKTSKNGWLQLKSADGIANQDVEGLWISGSIVGTSLRNYDGSPVNLYVQPDKSSEIAGTIKDPEKEMQISGCCEGWIYVKGINNDGTSFEGWLEPEMQCPNPVTTCP